MELRQLKQLVVLSETLNFHRAAERLHMAQPPLSTSVRKLEEELGVQLFERLSTGLRPTPAGEAVLQQARRTLFFAEEVRRAARLGLVGEQGRLRVGFVGSASFGLLPRIIGNYRRQFSAVDLTIEEGTTRGLLRRLEEHSLDLALVRFPVLEPSRARIDLLQPERLLLAVGAESPLAGRSDIDLAELEGVGFIGYSSRLVPAMHVLTQYAFQQAGIQPRVVQEAVQVHAMLGLVESGLGVALMPDSVCRYAGDGVHFVELRDLSRSLKTGIALAQLPESLTPTARHFIEHAQRESVV